jgi:rhodanese-related sulfurtransferase
MVSSHGTLENVQGALSNFTLNSVRFKPKSTADELKYRLDRGDRSLTIVDIRAPKYFNLEHIKGAISVPFSRLEDLARSALSQHREIYIYGESDEHSLHGSRILLGVGFRNVAQIIGGLTTWREIAGATEGSRFRLDLKV